jgi:hypothetical protein
MAMGQLHWGTGAGATATVITMAMGQWGGGGDVYVLFRGSMSWIVVDKNVQNVWTAIIREVVPAIKTGPF